MDKVTTAEMKKINRKRIFQLIYQQRKIAKQEIAQALRMSLPTITQNLRELQALHLIEKKGCFESTGGRKAQAIVCAAGAKIAVGAEISRNRVRAVAVDLYGEIVGQGEKELEYQNSADYYRVFGTFVNDFIDSLRLPAGRVLGVGIAIQGLISPDGQTVTYGKVFGCTGASVDDFSAHLPCPCALIHDAEAAALAELWFEKDLTDAIYLNLSNNIGGAVIIGGRLHKGRELKSGMIEHMTIVPEGLPCYCGKKGCFEAYCSVSSLLRHRDQSINDFFQALRAGEPEHLKRWQRYLSRLALAIDSLHMVIDCDVVLGGYLAPYLTREDIKQLHQMIAQNTAFAFEHPFVRISRCKLTGTAQGAALPFVSDFLNSL